MTESEIKNKFQAAVGVALELSQVSLAYPSPRAKSVAGVHGIDLSINEGEILALLGPSGCGKTTTLRLIAGLERPETGSVVLRGQVVSGNGHYAKSALCSRISRYSRI